MTVDHLVALSLLRDLPRPCLTERLRLPDPELVDQAERLLHRAAAVRTDAAARGIHFLAWNDPGFPPALQAVSDCPPGLWYRGRLDGLRAPCVAVVGSRGGSPSALATATQFGAELAAAGITVVSGLARGVDSAAHRGALRTGRTVAVLGSGHGRLYPREHQPLADEIARLGAVLSEYPPGVPPLAFHFPMRNRIISGLCRGVVVIEAAEQSGSLITASCALEQGREVLVVPGAVPGGRNTGGHALIRDGAAIVESVTDVLQELGLTGGSSPYRPANSCNDNGSGDQLLAGMEAGQSYDLEALARVTGISVPHLLERLSRLELEGLVQRADGGRFMRAS